MLLPALASAARRHRSCIPAIPGVAALPGPIATPAATPGREHDDSRRQRPTSQSPARSSRSAATGSPRTRASRSRGAPRTSTWVVDARPDSVDYLGRQATKITVVLGTATTDASGTFTASLVAPKDFGGIHDIYAVVDGMQVAKGGFLIARSATISAEEGPDRHDAHDHVHGPRLLALRGRRLAALRQQVRRRDHGELDARRRGRAHPRQRARSGRHTIEVADAISFKYLNIQQSPIPWGTGKVHDVHGHEGRRAPEGADRLAGEGRADARREDDAAARRDRRARRRDRAASRRTSGADQLEVGVTASRV